MGARGRCAAAKQALAAVSPEARTKLPASRALVAAEIALAENDGARAIHELDTIAGTRRRRILRRTIGGCAARAPSSPATRWKARALSSSESAILTDPASLRASREELFGLIRSAAERGVSLKAPPKTDPIVAGWLALGPVAVEMTRNPMHAAAALANWKRAYPAASGQRQRVDAGTEPNCRRHRVSGSGRAAAAVVGPRRGGRRRGARRDSSPRIWSRSPPSRPHVRIYDVAAESVAGAYRHAIDDGAGFVVGPLTKEDVAAVAPLSTGRTPVLALNFLADSASAARAISINSRCCRRMRRAPSRGASWPTASSRGSPSFRTASGATGSAAAFAEELTQHGGTLLDSGRYEARARGFLRHHQANPASAHRQGRAVHAPHRRRFRVHRRHRRAPRA